jgi:hypothetical protein
MRKTFFPTFGHEVLVDSRGPGGFMDGTEFHGELGGGFRNIRLGRRTIALQITFRTTGQAAALALRAHVAGVTDATPSIEQRNGSCSSL